MLLHREYVSLYSCWDSDVVNRGFINTPLAHAIADQETLLKHVIMPYVALKRIAEPEEVAKVILFLFSEEASYITGTVSRFLIVSSLQGRTKTKL